MTTGKRTTSELLALLGAFAAGGVVGWVARGARRSPTTASDWDGSLDVPSVTDADVHGGPSQRPNVDDELLSPADLRQEFEGGHGTSVADQPWAGRDPMHRAF